MSSSHCPLVSADRRLSDALKLIIQTKSSYFDPEEFRFNLNNTIQALRNVTFVLQNAKSSLSAFDQWYSDWQAKMKADVIMKWLVAARNIIVKQGDLETRSVARISILESWFDSPTFETDVPPFTNTEDFARYLSECVPKDVAWDVGLLRVERRWVHVDLPEHELVDCLVHSFDVLNILLHNGHVRLLSNELRKECEWFNAIEANNGKPKPFSLGQDWDRTVWLKLQDGTILVPQEKLIERTEGSNRDAIRHYLGENSSLPRIVANGSIEEMAASFFEIAKLVLKTDGYHAPTVVLMNSDGPVSVSQLQMDDRSEKHLMLRKVASEVERLGATAILLVNEVWVSRRLEGDPMIHAVDDPNREEALCLLAADNTGKIFTHEAVFVRNPDNSIRFTSEKLTKEIGAANIIEPIVGVWRRRNPKQAES